jgi:hypothetical protein
MAVNIQFLNLLIPISKIDKYYKGGFEQYKIDRKNNFESDDYLVKEGAMSSYDIENMVNDWEKLGLKPFVDINGKNKWEDVCVVDQLCGLTLPCEWVQINNNGTASYKMPKTKALLILPFIQENKDDIKIHCAIGDLTQEDKLEALNKYKNGNFKEWQEVQKNNNFSKKYILSLIYLGHDEWLFAGIYEKISFEENLGKCYYKTVLLDESIDLIGRLVISFDKNFRQSYIFLEKYIEELYVSEIKKEKI